MKVSDFQSKIAGWRLAENLTQEQLDQDCGFNPGTVARIEQGKLKMKNDQFILILKRTNRDLLSTLLEDCGNLYSELAPLAQESSGTGSSSAQGIWHDRALEADMANLFSAARTIFLKMTRTSDEKLWANDLLLRAASVAPSPPKRQRAGKRGKPPSENKG